MADIQGLTREQVKESEKKWGTNALTPKKKKTFAKVYWEKYDDPIVMVLLIALGINVLFTFMGKVDLYECAGILLSVIISTFVSAISDYSNENTFRRLQAEAEQIKCKVWRDGELREININHIVTGDTVLVEAGDMIPADSHILSGKIKVDQSMLSGESKETEKIASKSYNTGDFWSKSDVFRGSLVCSGEAILCVDTIGDKTVYGRLAEETQEEGRESPLSIKLGHLAKSISKFGCISAIIIVVVSFLNNSIFASGFNGELISQYFSDISLVISDLVNSLILGIIVIVVAVPDGLPLMIAIVCSLNMKKMLKDNVLVRKLIGIETAGEINILFTDKTGTITVGKPRVVSFFDGEGAEYKKISQMPKEYRERVVLSIGSNLSAEYSQNKIIGGNATEKALLEFIGKAKVNVKVISRLPFSSDNKYSMSVIDNGKKLTLIKGAPELILKRCSVSSEMEIKLNNLAKKSMRLIAVALCDGEYKKIPDKLDLVGVAVIRDDIRKDAPSTIAEVEGAGIQVVMITGDRCETAVAIAKEAGLLKKDSIVLTSEELGAMTDLEVVEILPKLRVVSRALPADKSRLVRIAQELGLVVGMTGDGVNDAPALKLADVGFAMGGGAEAAASAAEIVILDNNFRSIRNAILYGRTIYNSIKKFVKFQLTINIAAVGVSMLGPIMGIEKPLDISQMIWTNLMIDSLAAIAFGGEPALKKYMMDKPKKRDEKIIDKKMWSAIIVNGLYICSLSMLFFALPIFKDAFRYGEGNIYFYTGYFCFFIFISLFNSFNARCEGIDLIENLSLNKQFILVITGVALTQITMTFFGGSLLRTAPLTLKEWTTVIVPALTIFPVDIIRKIVTVRLIK